MSRLPAVIREDFAPGHQAIWDRVAATRPGLPGPYGMLMHVPELAERVAAVGDYFRFDAALPGADRELVILAATREVGARYPWIHHEPGAREVGTAAEAIDAVRTNGSLAGLRTRDRLLVELVRALIRTHALSDESFGEAMAELGREQLVEVITLVGVYTMLGFVVNGFALPVPDNRRTF